MSDPRLLGYLYGEAGNQGYAGQVAVANVLANRAAQNFRGYGTTLEAQATRGTGIFGGNFEFNGYRTPPASAAAQLQQAIDNAGNDTTGGATFFANPSGSTAAWARNLNSSNALKIGDHYFTDNTNGVPFQPSASTNASGALGANNTPYDAQGNYVGYATSIDQSSTLSDLYPGTSQTPNAANPGGVSDAQFDYSTDYTGGGGGPVDASQAFTADPYATLGQNDYRLTPDQPLPGGDGGLSGSDTSGGTGGGLPGPLAMLGGGSGGSPFDTSGMNPIGSLSSMGGGLTPQTNSFAQSGSAGTDSSTGAPVYLTDPNAVASKAGVSVQEGAKKLGEDVTKSEQHASAGLTADTGSLTSTATGITQYAGNLLYDAIPRIVAGIGALVLLGLGIWMIGKDSPEPTLRA